MYNISTILREYDNNITRTYEIQTKRIYGYDISGEFRGNTPSSPSVRPIMTLIYRRYYYFFLCTRLFHFRHSFKYLNVLGILLSTLDDVLVFCY